jgi:hypothetical protein
MKHIKYIDYVLVEQRNGTKNPEMNPCSYDNVILNRGVKNIDWEKDSLFNNWNLHVWIETRPLYLTLHENQSEMDQRSQCNT